MIGGEASTAVLICQARAVANGRVAAGRFADPVAMDFLRREERVPVERARSGLPPASWRDRGGSRLLLANAEAIVPRTVAIDDAIRARANPQLVILGAGLDGRAWRMAELAAVDVYEVDHPGSQQDKRDRCGDRRPVARSLRFVSVDFSRDALGSALAAAGHRESLATTWVWEGVVRYLTRAEVEATVAAVAGLSAPGSRLVVNYQMPSPSAALRDLATRGLLALARRPDPFAGEPRRSSWTPASMRELLAAHGLRVITDDDLLTVAGRLAVLARRARALRAGRVATADRPARDSRTSGRADR